MNRGMGSVHMKNIKGEESAVYCSPPDELPSCIDLRGVPGYVNEESKALQRPQGCIDLRGVPGYVSDEDRTLERPKGCTERRNSNARRYSGTRETKKAVHTKEAPSHDSLNAGWFEAILKRNSRSKGVSRVLSVVSEPAVPKGENFLSEILRVGVTNVLGSGETVVKSVIVKRIPDNPPVAQMIEDSRAFATEIYMYKDVFCRMEEVMKANGDTSSKLWCEFIDCTPNTRLVLDDLTVRGYSVVDRRKGMNLDHAMLTLKSLAKFHALSYVLLESGLLNVGQMHPCFLGRNVPYINDLIKGGFKTLVEVMKYSWGPEWVTVADRLESIGATLGDRLQEIILATNSNFKVLNHGDCWINNMMFKYDPHNKRPRSVKFIDFQLCHYNTPAMDLIYFIYSSLEQTVKREYYNDLITAYSKSLKRWLLKYRPGGLPDDLPNEDALNKEMERLSLIGLAVTCSLKPLNKADPEHSVEFDNLLQGSNSEEYKSHSNVIYADAEIESILKEDLPVLLAVIN